MKISLTATHSIGFGPPVTTPVYKPFRHIRELDGLRGLAALAVLFHHLFFTSIDWKLWPNLERWIGAASSYGLYGVDLFFVLSGFLITSLLLQDRDDPNYFHNFYWKRALRILPLYFLLLLVLVSFDRGLIKYALLCAAFMANFARPFHVTSDGPFWTLAIEEQFYLVWPQIVHRRTVQFVRNAAIGIIVAETVLRLVAASFGHRNYIFTFYHCDGLALGAWLACQHRCWQLERPIHGHRTVGKFRWIFVATLILVVLFIRLTTTRTLAFSSALFLTWIGLLLYSAVGGAVKHSGSPWLRLFRTQPMVFFGEISYCLYMVHPYVLNTYDRLHGRIGVGDTWHYWTRAFVIIGLSLLLCILSRYLIERPAQSMRRYVLRRRPPIQVVTETLRGVRLTE